MEDIRISLVDDHTLFRKGMAELINSFKGYKVVAESDNGKHFIRSFDGRERPDIVLLDINMPEMNGYETALWLKDNWPQVKVLALSMYDMEESVIKMLKAGAKGYLLKDADPEELLTSLNEISKNNFYHSELVNGVLLKSLNSFGREGASVKLNDRELQFLKLACTEMTYKEIADQMCLSPRTIDGYREALFEKLHVKSRVGLVMFAITEGMVAVGKEKG
jgi:two-component system, NarL family, invasion response regulator UvrY